VAGPGHDTFVGRGGNDTVQDAGAASYVLTNGNLTGTGSDTLQNIPNAVLTGAAGGTVFNVSGWTGSATLIGVSGTNTVVVNRDTNFTLTADTLTLASGGTFHLVDIQDVLLMGGPSGSTFDVGGWNGLATLTGVGGTNTVVASRAANFVLTDSSLAVSAGGTFTLVNVHNAVLTGAASGSTFDLRGWTGTDTVNSAGGANPVQTPRGSPVATLEGSANLPVATFTDAGLKVSTNYAGTVNWGDGTFSAASFGAAGAAVTVSGSHFYHEEGNYTVTTTFSQGTAFTVIVISAATVADAPLTNIQVPVLNATEGIATAAVVVATFTDPGGSEPVGDYAASILWGDGGTSAGTIVDLGNGQFDVTSSHIFAEEGNYPLTVTLTHDQLPPVTVSGTARVADAPLTATATPFVPLQGIPLNGAQVATFVDTNPLGQIGDFTATINWGDGTTSSGTVMQPGGVGTAFAVTSTHTYAAPGTDTISATITDDGGKTATASFTAAVGSSIFVLDPTASGALTATGTTSVTVTGAVMVDSNSPTALTASGNSQITASQILVTGGVSVSNGAILSPTPTTGVPRLPDPLAGLPVPPSNLPSRGSVNLSKGSLTIQPGIYTQILASGKGTVLTLSPGVYVIKGGGLSISNSASIVGTGVVIYNAGSNFPNPGGTFGAVSLSGSGSISLTAATSGTYAGVLLFQARDNTLSVSVTANAVAGLSGVLYAPAAGLVINGSGQLNTAAVVDQLKFTGNGGSAMPASATSGTSAAAALLQTQAPATSDPRTSAVFMAGSRPAVVASLMRQGTATPVGVPGPSAATSGAAPDGRLATPAIGTTVAAAVYGDQFWPSTATDAAGTQAQSLQALDAVFAEMGGQGDDVTA
jgi:hypothetical protein